MHQVFPDSFVSFNGILQKIFEHYYIIIVIILCISVQCKKGTCCVAQLLNYARCHETLMKFFSEVKT